MPLIPVRFKNAQELSSFLNRPTSEEYSSKDISECKQLLSANDNNQYLLKDVLQFINENTEEQIKDMKLSFCIETEQPNSIYKTNLSSLNLTSGQSVTLAQLKANPTIIEHLVFDSDVSAFLQLLNLNLYFDLPSRDSSHLLRTWEEIKRSMELLEHDKLMQEVRTDNLLMNSLSKFPLLWQELSSATNASLSMPPSLLTNIKLDVYTVTLRQEIKLKYYLLEELSKLKGPKASKQIELWIQTLEENSSQIKILLNTMREKLKSHCKATRNAQLALSFLETGLLLSAATIAFVLLPPSLLINLALMVTPIATLFILVGAVAAGVYHLNKIINNKLNLMFVEEDGILSQLENGVISLLADSLFVESYSNLRRQSCADALNYHRLNYELKCVETYEFHLKSDMETRSILDLYDKRRLLKRSKSLDHLLHVEKLEEEPTLKTTKSLVASQGIFTLKRSRSLDQLDLVTRESLNSDGGHYACTYGS